MNLSFAKLFESYLYDFHPNAPVMIQMPNTYSSKYGVTRIDLCNMLDAGGKCLDNEMIAFEKNPKSISQPKR